MREGGEDFGDDFGRWTMDVARKIPVRVEKLYSFTVRRNSHGVASDAFATGYILQSLTFFRSLSISG